MPRMLQNAHRDISLFRIEREILSKCFNTLHGKRIFDESKFWFDFDWKFFEGLLGMKEVPEGRQVY